MREASQQTAVLDPQPDFRRVPRMIFLSVLSQLLTDASTKQK